MKTGASDLVPEEYRSDVFYTKNKRGHPANGRSVRTVGGGTPLITGTDPAA